LTLPLLRKHIIGKVKKVLISGIFDTQKTAVDLTAHLGVLIDYTKTLEKSVF
jgi:hypothetical protein